MDISIKCTSEDKVYCPRCGSTNIIAKGKPVSHCGQCGTNISVKYVEKVDVSEEYSEEYGKFKQLSIFDA